MIRTSNRRQLKTLLDELRTRPNMGRRDTTNRASYDSFWEELTAKLNALGPPVKEHCAWKKAWTDHCRYVRVKAHKKGKKPPPYVQFHYLAQKKYLTLTTAAAMGFQLEKDLVREPRSELSMSEFEYNNEDTLSPNDSNDGYTEQSTQPAAHETTNSSCHSAVIKEEPECTEQMLSSEINTPYDNSIKACEHIIVDDGNLKSPEPHQQSEAPESSDVALEEEEFKNDLSNKLELVVQQTKAQNIQLKTRMKKIEQKLNRLVEIKKVKLTELKRHNREIEELRRREVESKIKKNERLLELEELKLKLMNKTT